MNMDEEMRLQFIAVRDILNAMNLDEPQADLFGHKDKTQGKLQKEKSESEAPPGLKRIKQIFGHKDTTLPNKAEMKAYNGLCKRLGKAALYSQIDTITRFYKFKAIELSRGNTNLWSTSAQVLLNKWDEMQDRAVSFLQTKPKDKTTETKSGPEIREPKHWREWAEDNYPGKDPGFWKEENLKWEEIPFTQQLEIHRNCR